jgi:hypothetical protein
MRDWPGGFPRQPSIAQGHLDTRRDVTNHIGRPFRRYRGIDVRMRMIATVRFRRVLECRDS